MHKGKIHIGTSGWSYKDWKEIFYPPNIPTTDWLSYYAKEFDSVELNMSFYHLPKEQTVLNWVKKVPKEFKFCPKMSRYVTHIKRLAEVEEPLQRFFSIFDPIQKNCGPILLQLPPSLKFDAERSEYFFKLLRSKYSNYKFALEVRHNSWLEDEAIDLITKHKITFVISDSGVGFPYKEAITAKNVYIRFHGPKELYASLYTNEAMKNYAKKIKHWQQQGHTIWVYFNNDYYGYGLENARTLKTLLGV